MRRLDAQDAVEAARNAEAQDRAVGLVPFHNPDQTSLREIARGIRAEGALLDDTIRCAVAVDEGVDHLRVEPAYAAPVAYACGIDDAGRSEGRRGGEEGVRKGRYTWSPDNSKNK